MELASFVRPDSTIAETRRRVRSSWNPDCDRNSAEVSVSRCLYSALPAEARGCGSWGHHGVFYQLPDGSINWLLYCEHGAAAATDLAAARALAARSYAASIGVLMAATPAPTNHDVHDLRSGYWRHGAVVLVGDAAHACSPHLAMGANLALADAEALGECLAAVVSGRQAVPAALGRFED